jgi:chorismate mutase/prephenate dehydratase
MMSSSLSPVHEAQAASTATEREAPASPDGWRTGGLPALRAELDRIDDAVHDLLMQRAGIVEYVARAGKPAAFRPGREASIVRRLLARHRGAMPQVALVRIWRELMAGSTSMQGGFSLSVCDTEHSAPLTQLAREHFGALTPLRAYGSAGQALADVSQGSASVAVLPYPSDADNWWLALLHHEPRLHIVARLPFWKPRPDGFPSAQALVVAATPPDASEADQSCLGLECDSDVSRARLSAELSSAGLKPETMVLVRQPGSPIAHALVEIEGYLTDDDARLGQLGSVFQRKIVLGGYAVPIAGATR